MNKRYARTGSILLGILLLFLWTLARTTATSVIPSAGATIRCSSAPEIIAGQSVTFEIVADFATLQNTIQLIIDYDPSVLQYQQFTMGSDFNQVALNQALDSDTLLASYTRDASMPGGTGVTGLVNVATVTFTALSSNPTELLFFNDGTSNGSSVYFVGVRSDVITEKCVSSSLATVTPTPNNTQIPTLTPTFATTTITPTATPTPGATITPTVTSTPGATVTPTVTPIISGTVTPTATATAEIVGGNLSCLSNPYISAGSIVEFKIMVEFLTPHDTVQVVLQFDPTTLKYLKAINGSGFNQSVPPILVGDNLLVITRARTASMPGGSAATGLLEVATVQFEGLAH